MKRKHSGFTLLEILVALAVLAIALGAITQSIGSATGNISYLRDKTYAHWVAMNRVAYQQMIPAIKNTWPNIGIQDGVEDMGGHEWSYREITSETANINIRRVDVEVRRDRSEKNPLVKVSVFLGRP